MGDLAGFEARLEKELEFGWGGGPARDRRAERRRRPRRSDGGGRGTSAWDRARGPSSRCAMLQQLDVRHVLPSIRVPTLVISRRDNRLVEAVHGRYLGEHIPGALPRGGGRDYFPFIGNAD